MKKLLFILFISAAVFATSCLDKNEPQYQDYVSLEYAGLGSRQLVNNIGDTYVIANGGSSLLPTIPAELNRVRYRVIYEKADYLDTKEGEVGINLLTSDDLPTQLPRLEYEIDEEYQDPLVDIWGFFTQSEKLYAFNNYLDILYGYIGYKDNATSSSNNNGFAVAGIELEIDPEIYEGNKVKMYLRFFNNRAEDEEGRTLVYNQMSFDLAHVINNGEYPNFYTSNLKDEKGEAIVFDVELYVEKYTDIEKWENSPIEEVKYTFKWVPADPFNMDKVYQ